MECCEKAGKKWQRAVILSAPVTRWAEQGAKFVYCIDAIGDKKISNCVFHSWTYFVASWSWHSCLWVTRGGAHWRGRTTKQFKFRMPLQAQRLSDLVKEIICTVTEFPYARPHDLHLTARTLTLHRFEIKWDAFPVGMIDTRTRKEVVLRARPKRAPKRPRCDDSALPLQGKLADLLICLTCKIYICLMISC